LIAGRTGVSGGGWDVVARHLVESAALSDTAVELTVRLNWYRSLPLSCVERLEVTVDGVRLDPEGTTLELDGVVHSPADLAGSEDRWWPVLSPARVRAPLQAPSRNGDHGVELLLGTRIPYLVGPAGDAVVILDRARTSVTR
jgi:hypothetical protein